MCKRLDVTGRDIFHRVVETKKNLGVTRFQVEQPHSTISALPVFLQI